ncbi:hypothetical protein [Bacteroides finegoldii]|jgi:hypothetical protein|uniref:hypothetical protein n=1 Tax=Bacteroides finegoldii TaxID=338188 RepID=UPI001E638BD1|nr:hypothetical protein [Bacteroides finegoldii]MDC7141213.1 hypothetical protein [Bacteroides finegoldii]DAO13791.1 MAG TPA: hypothetical protein [Caudoviricetes sp.]DAW70863.1 MAG TPA: hypothetical protein [Caudoviricetes sp.]
MANGWGNSGYRRATTLVVDKKIGGTSISGYPKTYSVLDTFGNYMAVTAKELSMMSLSDYNTRMSAFKRYIEGIETGITVDVSNIRELNTGVCPITLTGK